MIAPDNPFRQWRKRLGLSQSALAQKIGYSERRIRDFETGVEDPPLVLRHAMSAVQRDLPPFQFEDIAA